METRHSPKSTGTRVAAPCWLARSRWGSWRGIIRRRRGGRGRRRGRRRSNNPSKRKNLHGSAAFQVQLMIRIWILRWRGRLSRKEGSCTKIMSSIPNLPSSRASWSLFTLTIKEYLRSTRVKEKPREELVVWRNRVLGTKKIWQWLG